MNLIDCNCAYGLARHPAFRYAHTPSELLAEMDFCGIDRALVYHAGMRDGSPLLWNPRIIEELAGSPRLEPTWAVLPSQTGEQPAAAVLLERMKASRIRALWAFPIQHNYQLDGLTFGPLLELLQERRVPLLARLSAPALGTLLRDFPTLTAVAVAQGPHSLERYLRPLLDAYPNLHLETSGLLVEGIIEEHVERYGHGRLLYGSAFPDNCSGGPLMRLMRAEIDDTARAAIAGLNLTRLLEGAQI